MMLYVVRHGETVWNVDHRVQGQTDVPLTDNGREQAKELRELVSDLNIDVVISSPLIRARETAEIIVDKKLPVNTDDRIIERDWGFNEGEVVDLVDTVDCWDFYLNTKGLEHEKVQDLMKRVSEFLEDIKVRYSDKNVLVVAHSAVLRAIHYLLSGIPEDGDLTRIDIPNLRIIEYKI